MPQKAGNNAKEKQELMVLKDQHSWLKKQNSSKENGKVKTPISGARKRCLSRKKKVFRSLFLNLEAKGIGRTRKPVLNELYLSLDNEGTSLPGQITCWLTDRFLICFFSKIKIEGFISNEGFKKEFRIKRFGNLSEHNAITPSGRSSR